MGKTKVAKETLKAAAQNLNEVLELKPPIATEFTSSLKGAALKAVEEKFIDQLKKDILEVATVPDKEGKSLIQPTDTLQPATIDVLEELGVEGIREKMSGKERVPSKGRNKSAPPVAGKEKAPVAEKEKTPAKGKKEAASKAGKEENVNDWGHRIGSQSDQIDGVVKKMVAKGKKELDVEAITKETKLSAARVNMHLKHLKERKLI